MTHAEGYDLPRLAVVVCTHNRSGSLQDTLSSLFACGDSGEPVDVVVMANQCSDDTLARLADFESAHRSPRLRLRWIEEPTPGKSHALNAALAHTRHEALCFVDDDQVVEVGFLRAVLTGLREHPQDDILCGRIWPAWDGSEPAWVHAQAPYRIPIRPFPEFDLGTTSRVLAADERLPSGGNITARRRVFERIGGFAVELGPTGHNLAGGEDHDFLQRALAAGFRIRYLPGVRQLHAIDPERMRTGYVLKKSYLRSRSSFLIDPPAPGPRLYMLRKVVGHALRVLLAWRGDRRFHGLVRLAASLGELAGAFDVARGARTQPAPGNARSP
jgi:glycosyltransferase involved in cell wall biosynthesis